MSWSIEVESGSSVRLPTAGKYCDRDIVVTATGEGGGITPTGTINITENGTYDVTNYANAEVNVAASGSDDVGKTLDGTLTAIDSDVATVINYACRNFSSLKTVNLPNCKSVSTYAFYYCTAMHTFNAPVLTSVSNYAFYNCTKLENLNTPNITSIGTCVFANCTALEKADFEVVKSIAARGLEYSGLTALILRRSDAICTLANTSAFTGTPIADGTGYIYVPSALVDTYKAATNWSTYADQFRAIEDYPDICGTEV